MAPESRTSPSAFVLMLAASIQATLLVPYVVLVPGERTNLFSPLLMLLPALALLCGARRGWFGKSFACWATLGVGLIAASLFSQEPVPALMRAFAFFAPAASGLFCAWRLLADGSRRKLFLMALTFCYCALGTSYWLLREAPHYQGLHQHALTGTLVLLATGPLHMVYSGPGPRRWLGSALIALGFALCLANGSRYLALLPMVLIFAAWWGKRLSLAKTLCALTAALALAGLFFQLKPSKVPRLNDYESTFYRLEGIPASMYLMLRHPLAGIGMRAPREELLQDYEPVFHLTSKENFLAVVAKNVTADNQYLSLPVGIGLPLSLLYFVLIWQLFRRYHGEAFRGRPPMPSSLAPAIPLVATLVHCTVYDGLFYPQVNWFFHLLLGMVALAGRGVEESAPIPMTEQG